MKKYFVLLPLIFCLLQACSSSKKSTSNTSGGNAAGALSADYGAAKITSGPEADGSSYEKAIVISSKSETAGVNAEYVYLRKAYPGYKLARQSLSHKDKKAYDIMSITTADGDKKDVYFDITGFFGKW